MPASPRLQALLRAKEENEIGNFLSAVLEAQDEIGGIEAERYMEIMDRSPYGTGVSMSVGYDDESAMSPLDLAAIVSSAIPIVGDVTGLAADADMYARDPESRNMVNYILTGAGVIPFVPAASQVRKLSEKTSTLDLSNLDEMPNIREQSPMERYEPPRGRPENLEPLLTKETGKRMMEYAKKGEQVGGRGWYNLAPLKEEFIRVSGPEKGSADFDRYVDFLAATSPRSRVDSNVRRASYLRNLEQQGKPFAGLENSDLPTGYGHLAHKTQDHMLQDLKDGGSFEALNRPKVSSFAENLKGNFEPMTLDTHNFSAIVGDPKFKKSPSKTQYKYLEEFQSELADKMNMSPAQFQASVWMGADTGVADARPFLQVFDDVVNRTAERNKVSKQQALEDFIKGNAPLYGLAAAIGAGTVLVPEENTPPAT